MRSIGRCGMAYRWHGYASASKYVAMWVGKYVAMVFEQFRYELVGVQIGRLGILGRCIM